jgi:RNA exonuclease 1
MICFWHPGYIMRPSRTWSCCKQLAHERGCKQNPEHTYGSEHDTNVRADWKYHPTSAQPFGPPTPNPQVANAIALDCEMGISITGESELIRLTAVDFFTGATLIEKLVCPKAPMKTLNTRYSGVSNAQMTAAVAQRTCLFGRDAARHALLELISQGTVLVVHGGSGDLSSLRILHPHVVDSYILEGYTLAMNEKREGGRSLKNLTKVRTGRDIQMKGKEGHDSLEDALAARELVFRFMQALPDF